MFKKIILVFTVLVLAGCDISKLSAKLMPDNVEAMAHRDIDAILAGNIEHFKSLKGDMSDEAFEGALENLVEKSRNGDEISRNIVSANVSKNAGLGEGTTARYEAVYEIHSTNGYTVVELLYMQKPQMETCCELSYINLYVADSSPLYETTQLVYKISGIIVLILIFGILTFFLTSRRKRKT